MTIAAEDLERITRELSGIRDFSYARIVIDKEIPPLQEEMNHVTLPLRRQRTTQGDVRKIRRTGPLGHGLCPQSSHGPDAGALRSQPTDVG